MSEDFLKSVEAPVNPNIPDVRTGDTVSVFLRIKEGSNERTQEFKGTVIRHRKGGNDTNFTVRRVASNGIGVERTFLMRSPRIEKVVVHRHAHTRRAQLYFLRERTGKSSRLKQKFTS
ncbi:MAG: 50S ribosomal protein L19 [Chloroflexota bacterium]|nr:MAG: 50S ribosomal protein L19 [Chloroflexota bacterium]